jgi:hypothetical protein
VPEPEQSIAQLEKELDNRLSPQLQVGLDVHETGGKKVIVALVPRGDDPPYALDDNKIYVRAEAETVLAVRDEIVGLVMRGRQALPAQPLSEPVPAPATSKARPKPEAAPAAPVLAESDQTAPRTGVEVTSVEEREGVRYYTMRDLRNGNVVKNVTHKSARRLWHYAIAAYDELPSDLSQPKIQWQGACGLYRKQKQGNNVRYDLLQRTADGYRYYFGVTDDGIHGPWRLLVGQDEE